MTDILEEELSTVEGLRTLTSSSGEGVSNITLEFNLNRNVETVFMVPREEYSYLSSRLVKEVCRLGGNLDGLVPGAVLSRLTSRLRTEEGAPVPP